MYAYIERDRQTDRHREGERCTYTHVYTYNIYYTRAHKDAYVRTWKSERALMHSHAMPRLHSNCNNFSYASVFRLCLSRLFRFLSGCGCLFQTYLNYVRSLPINDTPEIFGLHDNANITFAQNETFLMLSNLMTLQPKTATGGGKSREEVSFVCDFLSYNAQWKK